MRKIISTCYNRITMASGLTPTYLLPYPLSTDPVDVHGDAQDLAERLETVLLLKANINSSNIFSAAQTITLNSTLTGLTVNQTGTGNIALFEDASSPDPSPFVITHLGDVAVGKLIPDEKLDVVGNIKTTGNIIFEGTEDAYELTLTTTDPLADNTITLPSSTGTVALTNNKLSDFAATTSSELKTVISDETGTGSLVFADGPTINNLNLTGQVTGLELAFGNSIVFEGTTADDYELTLTAGNPTADRTVTLPDATTTLVGKDTVDELTNKSLSDSTTFIVDSIDNTKKINIDVTGTTGITGVLQTAFTTAKTIVFPDSAGTVALTNNKLSAFASTTSSELAGVISDETGTGSLVFSNGPTINNPVFTGQVSGLELAFGQNIVFEGTTADAYELTLSAGDPTLDRTITLPDATGTVALVENKLSVFASTSSAELAGVISDETGTGLLVFGTAPTLTGPVTINSGSATTAGLIIQGTSLQTEDILQVKDDIGATLFNIDPIGTIEYGIWEGTKISIDHGGTGATSASDAINNLLPNQSTATGQYLTTDGTNVAWATVDALPSQSGNSGKFLTTDGTSASWTTITLFPSQSGNSGKFLTTDGTNVAWATVDALPSQTGNTGKYLTTDGTIASWSAITVNAGYAQSTPPVSPAEGVIWLDTDGTTSPISVQVYRWTKTVSATTTTFSGNGDESTTLAYVPGTEYVYLNGVMLIRGSDYTASNGNDIVLAVAAVAGDIFQVVLVSSVNIVALATLSTTPPVTTTAGEVWLDTDGTITTSQNIRWSILPNAGTTLLSGLDTNSNRLQYVVGNEQVYQNGVLLRRVDDYTATNGLSITLVSPTVAGDTIDVFCNSAIVVSDTYSTTQSDNKYVYDSSYFVAGKNKIINGDFSQWQRGNSISIPNAADTYSADRFTAACYFSAGTSTCTRESFVPGNTIAGYEPAYFARLNCASTTTAWQFIQKIEDVRTFAGQTVTFSFWAKASRTMTASELNIECKQVFGAGGSGSVSINPTFSLSTSWARYSYTFNVPSILGKTIGTNSYVQFSFYGNGSFNSNTIDTWGWQVEAGNKMTNFTTASGTIGGELALCQRYYWRFTGGNGNFAAYGTGITGSTTQSDVFVHFPTPMRIKPTVVEFSTLALGDGLNTASVSTLTVLRSNELGATLAAGATGLTQYRPYQLLNNNNSTTSYLAVSAEL